MKKGFTLIELLAVIVILAIIALIATPIIINIINEARISSIKRSAKLYTKSLSTEITAKNLVTAVNPDRCTIGSNGVAACSMIETGDLEIIEVRTTGSEIYGGFVEFYDGKIINYELCVGDNYSVDYNENVTSNATYCKNLKDPNAEKYIAKFFVNSEEYKTDKNYNFDADTYNQYLEGSSDLVMPDIPLDKSVLDEYSVPVKYIWLETTKSIHCDENSRYIFGNHNANFIPVIKYASSRGNTWSHYDRATYSGSTKVKGSNVYSGLKAFKLEPGVDDYAYYMVPFYDGTTYTYEELNTTYKNEYFAIYTTYYGVDLDNVIGTRVYIYVGDYLNPDAVLYDEYYDIDPNSNDDYIDTVFVPSIGVRGTARPIDTIFTSDSNRDLYDAVRVVRLVVPIDSYMGKKIHFYVTYKDQSGKDYTWFNVNKNFEDEFIN